MNRPIVANDPTGHKCVGEVADCLKPNGSKGGGFTGGNGSGNEGDGGGKEPDKKDDKELPGAVCIQGSPASTAGESATKNMCGNLADLGLINPSYQMLPSYGMEIKEQPTIFIGYSWGGAEAYIEALKADWSIDLLVLIDPVHFWRGDGVSPNIDKPDNVNNMVIIYAEPSDKSLHFSSSRYLGIGNVINTTIPKTNHETIDDAPGTEDYIVSILEALYNSPP